MAPQQARPIHKNSRWVGTNLHEIGNPAPLFGPGGWAVDPARLADEDDDDDDGIPDSVASVLARDETTLDELACSCGSHRYVIDERATVTRSRYLTIDPEDGDFSAYRGDPDTYDLEYSDEDSEWACYECGRRVPTADWDTLYTIAENLGRGRR